ncbi:putative quinol monooxygenase [Rapidithrix thailandica]|uniref:Quinol monooxygenase n=1 Tax=Rapidithrix thailandica TaxID=413964 RepID=A0AAW9SAC7_9BACT
MQTTRYSIHGQLFLALVFTYFLWNDSQAQSTISEERNPSVEMGIITLLVTFRVKPSEKELFKQALLEDVQYARKEKGNITMELYEGKDRPNTLYLFERWENQKELDKHFEQPYTQKVLKLNETALIEPMEIAYLDDLAPLSVEALPRPVYTDKMVDLVVVFKVKEGKQAKFIRQFRKSVQHSRPETGNIAFHIHSVKDDAVTFVLYERWQNQEALDFHFEQHYTKELFETFKEVLDRPVEESLRFITEISTPLQEAK